MKTTIYWIGGLFFALSSFCVCGDGKQYTLNVPRVLLPFVPTAGTKSNFTLTSEHGCFSWLVTIFVMLVSHCDACLEKGQFS